MTPSQTLRSILRTPYHRILATLPGGVRQWVIGQRIRWTTPRMGSLRRTSPISSVGGRGRTPCRYYIEKFIERHANDIRGRVLECFDRTYTGRFGGNRVTHSDVL